MAYGDHNLVGGVKSYVLCTTPDFALADLQTIDAAATIEWEFSEPNPRNGGNPGILQALSNSATFEVDAVAHAKVFSAYKDIDCGYDDDTDIGYYNLLNNVGIEL